MAFSTPHLRHIAVTLGGLAVVLGGLSAIAIVYVLLRTDSGLLCSAPNPKEFRPFACSVYDVPFWTLGFSLVCATGALSVGTAWLVSAVRRR